MHGHFQDINTPDINLERDLIIPEMDAEIALGMQVSELGGATDKRFTVNIFTIVLSAIIFLIILAWFDFIQTAFYDYILPSVNFDTIPPSAKLWYAILLTIFGSSVCYIIFYYNRYILK